MINISVERSHNASIPITDDFIDFFQRFEQIDANSPHQLFNKKLWATLNTRLMMKLKEKNYPGSRNLSKFM